MDPLLLVQSMTPEIYEKLRTAVETGKWFDGSPLSDAQRESSMQAVMMYQSKVESSGQHMSVGQDGDIVHKSKRELKQQFSAPESIARFKQNDF